MVAAKKTLREKLDDGEITPQQAMVMALNHPLRVTLLTILTERPASPSQLEDAGVGLLTTISYHCRMLHELRQIEIVDEIPRRGAVEHIYRAINRPLFSNPDWDKFAPKVRKAISAYGVDEIFKDVNKALSTGTFDVTTKRHLSRTPMVLDERGFLEASAVQNEALVRILDIQAEAADRLPGGEDGEEGIPVVAAMACFQMPSVKSDSDE